MDVHIARSMLSRRPAARHSRTEPWGRLPVEVAGRAAGFMAFWEVLRRVWR